MSELAQKGGKLRKSALQQRFIADRLGDDLENPIEATGEAIVEQPDDDADADADEAIEQDEL